MRILIADDEPIAREVLREHVENLPGIEIAGEPDPLHAPVIPPLFAAVLSAAVLGEPPHPYHAVAFVLIVGGIWVSSRR